MQLIVIFQILHLQKGDSVEIICHIQQIQMLIQRQTVQWIYDIIGYVIQVKIYSVNIT